MFDDDDRRLVQVASIANAIGAAENASPWRALVWLAAQVEAGALPASLYIPVRMNTVDTTRASPDESLRAWRSMAKRAEADRKKDMLNYHLPTAASTWFVHVNDLMHLAESASTTDAVRAELIELAQRHLGPLPSAATHAPSDARSEPAGVDRPMSQAAMRLAREDNRLEFCEARGIVFDGSARLPDGVGDAAKALCITRQALSSDLKKAVARRTASHKEGNVEPRTH
jgi:hypothetical protein